MAQDGADLPRNYRLKALLLVEFYLRMSRLLTDSRGHDLEKIVIYLAVISAAANHYRRNPELLALYAHDAPIPQDRLFGISRRAIADSVGLPRETVRRKIAVLISDGLVLEEDGQVTPKSPMLDQEGNLKLALNMLKAFEATQAAYRRADEG